MDRVFTKPAGGIAAFAGQPKKASAGRIDAMTEERIKEHARVLLSEAMAEVKAERRAADKPLHGWKNEACLRAIIRAIENNAGRDPTL